MKQVNFNTNRPIIIGCLIILLGLGGFVFWSVTAKLSAASIANGTIVVESQRKKVQHLQGGWVKAIYVTEGQSVKKGDVLVELENSKAQADFSRLSIKYFTLLTKRAEIEADLENKEMVNWPNRLEVGAISDSDSDSILRTQIIKHQQNTLKNKLREGYHKQKEQLLKEQLQGNRYQVTAIKTQYELINEEIEMTRGLAEKGFVSKTKMLELKRKRATVEARLAELKADTELASQKISSLKYDYKTETADLKSSLVGELESVGRELRDTEKALIAAREVRDRITIRSKHNGTVVGMNVHTIGGVVNAGDVIMEIVPESDELIVEAMINAKDIDVVRQGLTAKVRLSAYNVRKTPPVQGEVIYVAADKIAEDSSKEGGYLIKVRLDDKQLESMDDIKLYPGMPTEVFVILESRTLWDYLTAPLLNTYYRAFKEV
ncbi:HlyD family type I secretion periplasmic adaptor subunit [Moritella sp. 24]|uniref:HlyD family type I secretion periplasmic adaptor subunit n=1 Tax=Moritella sp. 24 TaxID=2746230 RepID=UPI001BA82CBF|nr:HlyD family type I secretion periplasmic adaptor subunit [Moritella sp. 24]QUM76996.1 HlyD family type I secretion periplasmic adaptor subunit [Moritella sp. 24]